MLNNLPEFELLETLLWNKEEGFYLLERHLSRLFNSAKYFSENEQTLFTQVPTPEEITSKLIEDTESLRMQQIRLLLAPSGDYKIQVSQEIPTVFDSIPYVVLDDRPIDSQDVFLRHKTTHRVTYNQARERAQVGKANGPFDVVLYNEQGQITETSIGNIAIEMPDPNNSKYIWKTPSVECGLLGGVHREELISRGDLVEGVITLEELKEAAQSHRRIKVFNSVRKDIIVRLRLEDYSL